MFRFERASVPWLEILVVCAASLLLLPKLAVVHFVNETLWGQIEPAGVVLVALQDVAVAALVCAALLWLARFGQFASLQLAMAVTGFLLLVLMIDARARELWLKPTDWSLVSYAIVHFRDLLSGMDLFFNYPSGWGLSFRRLLFFVGLTYFVLWALIAKLARRQRSERNLVTRAQSLRYAAPIALTPLLIGISLQAEGVRYHMNDNIVVRPLVELFAGRKATDETAKRFEQKPAALALRLGGERSVLPGVRPFRNLVLVVYESVRWRDVNLDAEDGPAPTLRRMAREGMWSKSHVSVPHSSKAYYAVLTGRHPYPAIEMREVAKLEQPSYLRALRDQLGVKTYAFSSVFLGFENMGGLLRAIGIDVRRETGDLLAAAGRSAINASSFGAQDGPLYELSAAELARAGGPFAAILFPLAAHYPYACPGHDNEKPDHDAYVNCLAYSDGLMAKMLEAFQANGLMQDTLFVIVGDHGESFGEHGMYVHNSSLYEEETTVPLVFWSADGRMRQGRVADSRQIDIGPTIADLFNLRSEVPVQGVSLLRNNAAQPVYMATFFDDVALSLLEYPNKYLYEPSSGRLQQFDLNADPFERDGVTLEDPQKKAKIVQRLSAFRAYQEIEFSH
jgi:phosphoglycerol transferase MdoB-like AlkP superfamily enzyme